ncbi:MAG: RHS repeat-associated protein [Flavobacteriales bacterium]|jgi:RHS repeat-associated protein
MFIKTYISYSDYRYGFQGQEKDDEVKGEGNSLNFKYRMHDSRLGRFFAIDPLTPEYPELTPYQFSSNNPIGMIEIEGLEGQPVNPDQNEVLMNTPTKAGGKVETSAGTVVSTDWEYENQSAGSYSRSRTVTLQGSNPQAATADEHKGVTAYSAYNKEAVTDSFEGWRKNASTRNKNNKVRSMKGWFKGKDRYTVTVTQNSFMIMDGADIPNKYKIKYKGRTIYNSRYNQGLNSRRNNNPQAALNKVNSDDVEFEVKIVVYPARRRHAKLSISYPKKPNTHKERKDARRRLKASPDYYYLEVLSPPGYENKSPRSLENGDEI